MLTTLDTRDDVVIMSVEEVRRMIDAEAREHLNMTGEQFIERWLKHELPDSAAVADIGIWVRLLDLNGKQTP
ncbi:MAG: hypothetical protein ACRDIE_23340 [Chloroflexota bacterium]